MMFSRTNKEKDYYYYYKKEKKKKKTNYSAEQKAPIDNVTL